MDRAIPFVAETRKETGGWFSRERVLALVLVAATVFAFYLCYRLALPFLPALAWALALAVIARPLHDWVDSRVHHSSLAAGLAVAAVAAIFLVPALLVGLQLTRELAALFERVQAEGAAEEWMAALERTPWLGPVLYWVGLHLNLHGELRTLATTLGPNVKSFLAGSVYALVQSLITLFTLFFLFRDRRKALDSLRHLVPLSYQETDEVFTRVADTIHATVYGTLVVAAVQGALGGLMFWWLGLPAPVLWGVVMGLLAIVPYLGAFVVWAPAAAYLALQGDWGKALLLTGWGTIVVGLIDNLLYPLLVGNRLRLHPLLVFFAIVGGLPFFGASGIVLGPIVLALTYAMIDIWRRRTREGRTAEDGVHG